MRGEHNWFDRTHIRGRGSSPHARGALVQVADDERNLGIIPACAGSTAINAYTEHFGGDHPRMRGEHCSSSYFFLRSAGSSPHARGAL